MVRQLVFSGVQSHLSCPLSGLIQHCAIFILNFLWLSCLIGHSRGLSQGGPLTMKKPSLLLPLGMASVHHLYPWCAPEQHIELCPHTPGQCQLELCLTTDSLLPHQHSTSPGMDTRGVPWLMPLSANISEQNTGKGKSRWGFLTWQTYPLLSQALSTSTESTATGFAPRLSACQNT